MMPDMVIRACLHPDTALGRARAHSTVTTAGAYGRMWQSLGLPHFGRMRECDAGGPPASRESVEGTCGMCLAQGGAECGLVRAITDHC